MINKNHMHTFIGYLRLYRGHYYSIILTMENYKVKYAILDSNDKEVTDVIGVDWYDLVDVIKTMSILENDAIDAEINNMRGEDND